MVNLLKKPVRMAGIVFATTALVAAQGGFAGAATAGPPQGAFQPGQPGTNSRPQTRFAQPGTVNYIEGQVKLDGHSVTQRDIGSALVSPGDVLGTANGKAEMLLTPGVFMRLGPNSSVRMVSPSLSDTRVELVQGHGMMEVAAFEKENHIQVTVGGSATTVEAAGIYEFTTNPPMVRVFGGKVAAELNDRTNNVYKGEEVALDAANPKLKTQGFNVKKTELTDDLYAWSKLRADYTAQANMSSAETYAGYGQGWGYGPGFYGAGWYWDPYFDEYAFLMADGFMWDPFGFGFFSPGFWGAYGSYLGYGNGYGYGRGYGYGHGFTGRPGGAITRNSAVGAALGGGMHGGMGGFHGAAMGGGFHGGGGFGGGGFHGGGGGGGRR